MEVRHVHFSTVARGLQGVSAAGTCEEDEGWPAGSAASDAGGHLRWGDPHRGGEDWWRDAADQGAALILPFCNTEAMNLHLAEIAKAVAPGAHAVLLVDQAGWHLSARLVVPANITNIPLPSKCPELNPVENIWQYMRDNWLSNRVFKSYDDIVDHCCYAWNTLVDLSLIHI